MKKIVLASLLILGMGTSFAQSSSFCFSKIRSGATQKAMVTGNSKSMKTINLNDLHSFIVMSKDLKAAYSTVLEYDLSSATTYEKLGSISCYKVSVQAAGKSYVVEGKNKTIDVFYDGTTLKIILPELVDGSDKSIQKSFYIPQECIKDFLNSFKWK